MSKFKPEEVVAHWHANQAVYAVIIEPVDYIKDIYPDRSRVDYMIETPAKSGAILIVKAQALAALTEQEQHDYVMALLEDRDTMKIPRF